MRELIPYAGTFPEVYQRMGMVIGRQGDEAGGYEYLGRYYWRRAGSRPPRSTSKRPC